MATFKIYFNPDKAKRDGHIAIYILVRHHRKQLYLNSNITCKVSDLRAGMLDDKTRRAVELFLDSVEKKYKEIHIWADTLDIKDLVDELKKDKQVSRIDFLDFVELRIKELFAEGREGTGKTYISLLYALRDFHDQKLYVDELTLNFLLEFEKYLRSPKTVIRKANNCTIKKNKDGFSDNATVVYMQRFKAIYNELKRRSEDPLPDPFVRYRFPKMRETLNRNVSIEVLRKVVSFDKVLRYPVGRESFMLSLFLCGINLADLYSTARVVNGRVEYNRKKTSKSRTDAAFSSIEIQPEAKALIAKYTDENGEFILNRFYKTFNALTYSVNKGLKEISEALDIDPGITYYQARHSVATIMSNELDIPDSHVKMVLNHNLDLGITNKYIKKDFSKLDRANRKFLDHLFANEYEDLI